jgi:hypothetical protein
VRLEPDEEAARVGHHVRAARADGRHELLHVRRLAHQGGDGLLLLQHGVEGDVLSGLREGEDLAGVLVGDEALGNDHEEVRGH